MVANDISMFLQMGADTAATGRPYLLTVANVFLVFFIMLGPLKAIGPFFVATRQLDAPALRAMAWRVFALSAVSILVAGLLGSIMLRKWQISPPVMELAGGLVFLLVALQMVLAQYQLPPPAPEGKPQLLHLVFPTTITPYGIAAVITMMALSAQASRALAVIGLAIIVMALNLLAMLFVRQIMRWIGPIPLQILAAVLGILQVALALQFMVTALRELGLPIPA